MKSASVLMLLFAVSAGFFFNFSMPHGVTVASGDSVDYLDGARNILDRKAFVSSIPPAEPLPVTHFPPLYSLAIAAAGLLAKDLYSAARIVNVLCFAATVLFAALLVLDVTAGQIACALAAGGLVALNPSLMKLYSGVWSEVLFIPLGLAGLWAIVRFARTQRLHLFLIAAALFGLTAVARYSGVVWLAVGIVAASIAVEGSRMRRFALSALFALIMCVPLALLFVRNRVVAGSVSDRGIAYHPVGATHLTDAMITYSSWLAPWRWTGVKVGLASVIACTLLILCVAIAGWRRESENRGFRTFGLTACLFYFAYIAHLLLAISFVHFNTPLDERILSPLLVTFLCALGAMPALISEKGLRIAALAGCTLLITMSASRASAWVMFNRRVTTGYLAPSWLESAAAAQVRKLPPSAAIFSNKPEAIYLSLQKPARPISCKRNAMTLKPNLSLQTEVSTMGELLRRTNGVIVYFHPPKGDVIFAVSGDKQAVPLSRLDALTIAELLQALPLKLVTDGETAAVYKYAD